MMFGCVCIKITQNFLTCAQISIKNYTLQDALRYNFALLSLATFSESDGERILRADAFSEKIFPTDRIFCERLKFRVGTGQ